MEQKSDLERYEEKQAEIRKLLKQIEAGLEKHDRATSGKPGGKNNNDVWDLNNVVHLLQEARTYLS